MKPFPFFLFFMIILINSLFADKFDIQWAKIQGPHLVQLQFKGTFESGFEKRFHIQPDIPVRSVVHNGNILDIVTDASFRSDTHYYLSFRDKGKRFLQPDGILDSLYSEKPLGYQKEKGRYTFRIFAPRAKWVRLVEYNDYATNGILVGQLLKI